MRIFFVTHTKVALFALLFSLLSLSCSTTATNLHNTSQSLYTQDGSRHSIEDAGELIEDVYSRITNDESKHGLIIFIHGRGNHPKKAFEQNLITQLESDNNALVIMFHWPSSGKFYSYPENAARRAANDFEKFLKTMIQVKSRIKNPPKTVLLAHSLGSYVLEETLRRYSDKINQPIFDTALLSSSASRSKDHVKWIANFQLANKVYITSNKRDPILKAAGFRKFAKRLGKSLTKSNGDYFDLAANASYLELSGLKLGHRYYLKKNIDSFPVFQKVVGKILQGVQPDLSQIKVDDGAGSSVYIFGN